MHLEMGVRSAARGVAGVSSRSRRWSPRRYTPLPDTLPDFIVTDPDTVGTLGVPLGAMRSTPSSCRPPGRGACHESTNDTGPCTGQISPPGDAGAGVLSL